MIFELLHPKSIGICVKTTDKQKELLINRQNYITKCTLNKIFTCVS